MGDRCYVSIICREQDVPAFEEIGFERNEWNDPASGYGVAIEGNEMNYAATDELEELARRGIPFTGSHGSGGEYGPMVFAAANSESIWVSDLGCGMPAVCVNRDGTIAPQELAAAMTYYRLDTEAERLIAVAEAERDAYLMSLSEEESSDA